MHTAVIPTKENLAFAHWQYYANEKAYESNIITKPMYEYAREELMKRVGDLAGFIEGAQAAGKWQDNL